MNATCEEIAEYFVNDEFHLINLDGKSIEDLAEIESDIRRRFGDKQASSFIDYAINQTTN